MFNNTNFMRIVVAKQQMQYKDLDPVHYYNVYKYTQKLQKNLARKYNDDSDILSGFASEKSTPAFIRADANVGTVQAYISTTAHTVWLQLHIFRKVYL